MISKLLGAVILIGSLAIVYIFDTMATAQGAFRIFHLPAIILTGLGPFGLVLLCSEWSRIATAFKLVFSCSPKKQQKSNNFEANLLFDISQNYYRQGTKALERNELSTCSELVNRTIKRLSIRLPITDIISLLEKERFREESKITQSIGLLGLGVRLAPSIGMLGTILGMVQLLAHLKDPSNIGSHMSLALLTTFYGLFFSLILWMPLQQRLEIYLDTIMKSYDQVSHWLEILEERKPTQYFADSMDEESVHKKPTKAASVKNNASKQMDTAGNSL